MRTKVAAPLAGDTPHFDFEREAIAYGHRWVAGVDEVGRGPLAGPVGVAAVILDPDDLPVGLDDFKVLPAAERESLCEIIFAKASASRSCSPASRKSTLWTSAARRCARWRALSPRSACVRTWRWWRARCARWAHLPGPSDHRRRRSLDVDRRRLDRRQDDPRRPDAQPRARLSEYGFAEHVGYATAGHRRALMLPAPAPITGVLPARRRSRMMGFVTPKGARPFWARKSISEPVSWPSIRVCSRCDSLLFLAGPVQSSPDLKKGRVSWKY